MIEIYPKLPLWKAILIGVGLSWIMYFYYEIDEILTPNDIWPTNKLDDVLYWLWRLVFWGMFIWLLPKLKSYLSGRYHVSWRGIIGGIIGFILGMSVILLGVELIF
ncbi:MAG: hypothetical protein AAF490_04975 [Chloroflexota bacterium]